MGNRVDKIREKYFIKWYYVPKKENPDDIGSRGSLTSSIPKVWWKSPAWLPDMNKWPNQARIEAIVESSNGIYDTLLNKHDLQRTLRVSTWISRFLNNCKNTKEQAQ